MVLLRLNPVFKKILEANSLRMQQLIAGYPSVRSVKKVQAGDFCNADSPKLGTFSPVAIATRFKIEVQPAQSLLHQE